VLSKIFDQDKLNKLADNPDVEVGGKKESVFDLTEEKKC